MAGLRMTPATRASRDGYWFLRAGLLVAVAAAAVALMIVLAAPGRAGAAAPRREAAPPRLSCSAAILVEAASGQTLYGASADVSRAIASTTKLMTALVTLERIHRLSRMFTQNDYVSASEDSQIGLVPGERMSVRDLMLALLLPSADDAAEDLAYNIGHGSVARFVWMMNAKARELGLTHTHYSTPIGLDTPGNYSSAADLVKLARYVMQSSPFFRRAVAAPSAVLQTGSHVRVVANRNDLVGRVSWINGVKTGHTNDAGYVLVGSGTRDGMTLITAVLGTPSETARDDSTLALLNWGFDNFRMRTPVQAGQVLAGPTVHGRKGLRARVVADLTYSHVFARAAHLRLAINAPHELNGPLQRHTVVGTVAVVSGRKVVARIPLVLAGAVPAPAPVTSALDFITRPFTLVLVVVLVAAVIGLAMFRRARVRGRRAEPA
jgi:serine-type D-Ala-D-Ala carboxypeptidase (penicillin-binding protein 5/6)